jgi:hypothetical protein
VLLPACLETSQYHCPLCSPQPQPAGWSLPLPQLKCSLWPRSPTELPPVMVAIPSPHTQFANAGAGVEAHLLLCNPALYEQTCFCCPCMHVTDAAWNYLLQLLIKTAADQVQASFAANHQRHLLYCAASRTLLGRWHLQAQGPTWPLKEWPAWHEPHCGSAQEPNSSSQYNTGSVLQYTKHVDCGGRACPS